MGDPKEVRKWKDAAPGRIVMGTSFESDTGGTNFLPVEDLRTAFTKSGMQVMGEVGLQVSGHIAKRYERRQVFRLGRGVGYSGRHPHGYRRIGPRQRLDAQVRGSMGNPLLLEEVLARHPKLRLWIMHAGYPMIDNLLTLLQANSHVYVDVAGLIWSYPLKEVHGYIRRIVEAGFEDRVMFGTDQMIWPKLMATSIGVIEGATYLTPSRSATSYTTRGALSTIEAITQRSVSAIPRRRPRQTEATPRPGRSPRNWSRE
ncbi:MAG: amidohydrolase family protein [Ignavibacteriota bacterium]